jgi:glyoxylase-like metal-dependent hydrolase (beta-lactamase superfamily II)
LIRLGDLHVEVVTAGRFRLDGGAMFGVVPRVLWERLKAPDEKNRIELALNCLLVRSGKRTVVVETGMGEKWEAKEREIFALRSDGGILAALQAKGVSAESVDTVILTHLHFDHAGGATVPEQGGEAVPAFPNADYVVQRSEWEFAEHLNERTRASYRRENYEPIRRAGRLKLVEGEAEILPGVEVVPLPGHTPGLQGVLVRGGGRSLFYPSDLVPTAAHLPYPYIMGYDVYPLTTLETRKKILPRAAAEEWLVVLGHETATPLGVLREEGQRLRLIPREASE